MPSTDPLQRFINPYARSAAADCPDRAARVAGRALVVGALGLGAATVLTGTALAGGSGDGAVSSDAASGEDPVSEVALAVETGTEDPEWDDLGPQDTDTVDGSVEFVAGELPDVVGTDTSQDDPDGDGDTGSAADDDVDTGAEAPTEDGDTESGPGIIVPTEGDPYEDLIHEGDQGVDILGYPVPLPEWAAGGDGVVDTYAELYGPGADVPTLLDAALRDRPGIDRDSIDVEELVDRAARTADQVWRHGRQSRDDVGRVVAAMVDAAVGEAALLPEERDTEVPDPAAGESGGQVDGPADDADDAVSPVADAPVGNDPFADLGFPVPRPDWMPEDTTEDGSNTQLPYEGIDILGFTSPDLEGNVEFDEDVVDGFARDYGPESDVRGMLDAALRDSPDVDPADIDLDDLSWKTGWMADQVFRHGRQSRADVAAVMRVMVDEAVRAAARLAEERDGAAPDPAVEVTDGPVDDLADDAAPDTRSPVDVAREFAPRGGADLRERASGLPAQLDDLLIDVLDRFRGLDVLPTERPATALPRVPTEREDVVRDILDRVLPALLRGSWSPPVDTGTRQGRPVSFVPDRAGPSFLGSPVLAPPARPDTGSSGPDHDCRSAR